MSSVTGGASPNSVKTRSSPLRPRIDPVPPRVPHGGRNAGVSPWACWGLRRHPEPERVVGLRLTPGIWPSSCNDEARRQAQAPPQRSLKSWPNRKRAVSSSATARHISSDSKLEETPRTPKDSEPCQAGPRRSAPSLLSSPLESGSSTAVEMLPTSAKARRSRADRYRSRIPSEWATDHVAA